MLTSPETISTSMRTRFEAFTYPHTAGRRGRASIDRRNTVGTPKLLRNANLEKQAAALTFVVLRRCANEAVSDIEKALGIPRQNRSKPFQTISERSQPY